MKEEIKFITPEQIEDVYKAGDTLYGFLKGHAIKCLDKGFVQLVDWMGDDNAIVQAARVSYGKGTKTVSEDRGLIRYLMRHLHTTPFEMCEFKFLIRIPMDAWRQMIRHRTASVNEYSTRYSVAINDKQETHPDEWRLQSGSNKQGSEGFVTEFPEGHPGNNIDGRRAGWDLSQAERDFHSDADSIYKERLAFGVAREQARKDLPLSTYTEAYWKIDLKNLFHFLSLRLDSHAQKEIREYAQAIAAFVKRIVPLAWEAFEDYDRLQKGLLLSNPDITIINLINCETHDLNYLLNQMIKVGFVQRKQVAEPGKLTREGKEFLTKLDKLGIYYEHTFARK